MPAIKATATFPPQSLLSKSLFAFDLDDTLHCFRKVSRAASQAVFEAIVTYHSAQNSNVDLSITISDLSAEYGTILKSLTANAFVDGRSSSEYRKERFVALLRKVGLEHDDELMEHILSVYQAVLDSSLEAKPGADSLLKSLKERSKKVVVISEGPVDAQIWTIEKLGLSKFVDRLYTPGMFGLDKLNGLIGKVLQKECIDDLDVVYIGDNLERDVIPAVYEGCFAILYDEGSSYDWVLNEQDGLVYYSVKSLDLIQSALK